MSKLAFRARVAAYVAFGWAIVPVVTIWDAIKTWPFHLSNIYNLPQAWQAFKQGEPVMVEMPEELKELFRSLMEGGDDINPMDITFEGTDPQAEAGNAEASK